MEQQKRKQQKEKNDESLHSYKVFSFTYNTYTLLA